MKVRVDVDHVIIPKCPGCGFVHVIPTAGPTKWVFNGNADKPTLSPSAVHTHGRNGEHVCHYHLTDGRMDFQSDCTAGQANTTVELPEL